MSKKVTLVIPVYNGSNYLKDAIDSALAQTYKNLEILVVNDGSNDEGKTRDIALSYGDKIKYYEKENGGVSTALNLAIKEMTGDYLSWLSHDDMYYPNKIERQIEELEKYSDDENIILYSNFDLINEHGEKTRTVYLNHQLLTEKPDYAVLRSAIGGITLLLPKRVFEEYGEFDPKLRCVQDYDFWFRILDKYKFVHMEDVLAMTRQHSMQDSNTSPRMLVEGNEFWYQITKNYPLEKKIKAEGSEFLFYKEMENYLHATPYRKAAEEVALLAEKCYDKVKKTCTEKTATVVIIDNGNPLDLEKTVASIQEQTLKNIKIIIEGKTKLNNIPNSKNRLETQKKISTDYHAFLTAGITVKSNWLQEEIITAEITDRAIIISDFNRPNKDEVSNNPATLFAPLDCLLFNSKLKVDYQNMPQYICDMFNYGGCYMTDSNYLITSTLNYDIDQMYKLFEFLLEKNLLTTYQKAVISYDLACIYNKYTKTDKPVFFYERCNELKELMFSRSFRMLKKYIDHKHLKKQIRRENGKK